VKEAKRKRKRKRKSDSGSDGRRRGFSAATVDTRRQALPSPATRCAGH